MMFLFLRKLKGVHERGGSTRSPWRGSGPSYRPTAVPLVLAGRSPSHGISCQADGKRRRTTITGGHTEIVPNLANLAGEEINTRLHTSRKLTPRSARNMASFWRVIASRGRIPLHGPAKRNREWPGWIIRLVLTGHT
jgi:hypothetical protein